MPKSKRYFEIFALKTSFQGFQELLHAKGWCEKSFWLLTIVAAIAFSTLLIYLGCARFFKEPVATTVTRSRVGPVELDVLFCPANWIDAEKLGQLKNASMNFLAYALSNFQDNYPTVKFSLAPPTYAELSKTDFALHMQTMLKNILLINLVTNKEFGEVWRNLKPEELFFLNADNLALLIDLMSAEQVGRAIILYVQKDFVGLAQYVMTKMPLGVARSWTYTVSDMLENYRRMANETEYSQMRGFALIYDRSDYMGVPSLLWQIRKVITKLESNDESYESDKIAKECEIAPLLCCDKYGQNCQSAPQYDVDSLRPNPEELSLMVAKIKAGNLTALYAYVQECIQQRVSEAIHVTNEAPSALTDEIWGYYQILFVEYIVSESYRTNVTSDEPYTSQYHSFSSSWLPYEEIANVRFIRAYMEKAALQQQRSSFPALFENIQVYVRENAEFQEFLNKNGAESSVESMRNFFAQANNTSNAMDKAIKQLSQAIAKWVTTEKTNYANFLRKNNFANPNDFLEAISPNASQIMYSLSLSNSTVVRPATSNLKISKVFNKLGACFRFSLFVESISMQQLKSSKVIFPSFKYRVYLNITVAESDKLLASNRAEHLLFFGEDAFEDYPPGDSPNGFAIPNKSIFDSKNAWNEVDLSVTDFVYHSKQNRKQAPCRSDTNYSSNKCVEACNDKYANGEYECSYLLENNWKLYDYTCSIFHFMETSLLSASAKRNHTDWNLLNNCYADCNPSCKEWFMKVSISGFRQEKGYIYWQAIGFDNATTDTIQKIGNPKGEPTEVPNGWRSSLLPEVRSAIISMYPTIWLTCINVVISTEVTMYLEEFTFTWDALFGIVGGQIGLVMGASVMSFVQLGYLLFVAWKKERNVEYTVNRQPSARTVVNSVLPLV